MKEEILKSVTRVLPKRDLQVIMRNAVKGGYVKVKLNGGYEIRTPGEDSTLVLKAMNGSNSYLCRISTLVFDVQ